MKKQKKTKAEKLKRFLCMFDEEIVTIDGHENAFIGLINTRLDGYVAVYSKAIIIDNLMRDDLMDLQTAEEFVSYNIEGAYVGKKTPMLIDIIPMIFWN